MAIFKPSPLIGAISGSTGSATFKLTRNGPVIAKRIIQRGRRTQRQLAQHSRFKTIAAAWHALQSHDQIAWKHFATHLPKTNALGLPYPRTGYQMFQSHNFPAVFAGLPIITEPPPDLAQVPALPERDFLEISINEHFVVIVPGPLDPTYLVIEACRPWVLHHFPPSPVYQRNYTWPFNSWTTLRLDSRSPGHYNMDLKPELNEFLGTPIQGEYLATRLSIWHPTALRSPKIILFGPLIT